MKTAWLICSNYRIRMGLAQALGMANYTVEFVVSEFELTSRLENNPEAPGLCVIHYELLWTIKPILFQKGVSIYEGMDKFEGLEYHGSLAHSQIRACKQIRDQHWKIPIYVLQSDVPVVNKELKKLKSATIRLIEFQNDLNQRISLMSRLARIRK